MNATHNIFLAAALLLAGCATVSTVPQTVEAPAARPQQVAAQAQVNLPQFKTFKRKLAVARFSNETRYGRTFVVDGSLDPLGKQAADMLMTRLIATDHYLVFERQDLGKVKEEQAIIKQANLVGVDALIMGSITEFGRSTTGKSGFLSATKVQTARAKVELRLVDPRTGLAFFSATGTGEASTESGEIAGYGSKADYDATLNDRAIAAAISDVQNELMSKLEERQWRTDVLKIDGSRVFISGGAHQGLKAGDVLQIMAEGETVKSAQSGFDIALPPTSVATIRVQGFFGDSEFNEGSVCELLSGSIPASKTSTLFVAEAGK